jgi:hypothetical protein
MLNHRLDVDLLATHGVIDDGYLLELNFLYV